MGDTKIEWTDKVWNPITGCTPISEGCANCYAKRMATRLAGRYGYPLHDPFNITLHENKLSEPLYWKSPQKVFVCSMGDLFHEFVPGVWQRGVFATIKKTPQHIYMLLTKRPTILFNAIQQYYSDNNIPIPQNLWLGVTAENQHTADERIPILLQIPAAVRFVNVEPILEPVDLSDYIWEHDNRDGISERDAIDWVIVGPETGSKARSINIDWICDLDAQCRAASVPFFDKRDILGEGLQEWPR